MSQQHLNEEDIELIVDKVCEKLERKLYLNIGSGVFGLLWKGILVILIGVAAYGAGVKHWF